MYKSVLAAQRLLAGQCFTFQSVRFPGGGDQWSLARTLEQLDELQGKLGAGKDELDDVVAALQTVVRDNRLSFRDRDLLTDDLYRLRDFRAGHEE